MAPAAQAALARMAMEAGRQIREERSRRGWTLRALADRAGVALGVAHDAEAGRVLSLQSYARLAAALGLRPTLDMADPRARRGLHAGPRTAGETADIVHAAMGEVEARALAHPIRRLAVDEPYQHYQFAGRADVLAWDRENLLHIENRTRFPNLQEAAGSYNAKRRYLARDLAQRLDLGPSGWRSVTHVMACLWSSEVLHAIRLRRASFEALCPDAPDALEAWLRGESPPAGVTSCLVLLDPLVPFGSRRRTIAAFQEPPRLDPRHRGYADAADALRQAGRTTGGPPALHRPPGRHSPIEPMA
jgi:transcriptional regulator with XRE-family HTH domain